MVAVNCDTLTDSVNRVLGQRIFMPLLRRVASFLRLGRKTKLREYSTEYAYLGLKGALPQRL